MTAGSKRVEGGAAPHRDARSPAAEDAVPLAVAIVGAGFAGLAAALDLVASGCRVTVIDAMTQPGGLAAGYRDPAGTGRWSTTTTTGSPATARSCASRATPASPTASSHAAR